MKEVTVGSNEAGQRLDKFLKKYLKEAGSGFLYKMLRKKNITLNGKKASGSEMLFKGDEIKSLFRGTGFVFFSLRRRWKNSAARRRISLQGTWGIRRGISLRGRGRKLLCPVCRSFMKMIIFCF